MLFEDQVAKDMAVMMSGEAAEEAVIGEGTVSVVVQRLGSRVENLPLLEGVQGDRAVIYVPSSQSVTVGTEISLTAAGEVWRVLRKLGRRPGMALWDCVSNTTAWGR